MYDGDGLYAFIKKKRNPFAQSTTGKLLLDFVETGCVDPALLGQLLIEKTHEIKATPWDLLDEWRNELVKFLILRHTPDISSKHQESFLALNRHPFWSECQLLSAYRALIGHFLGLPIPLPTIHQAETGAAPFEIGMWKWGDIPHLHLHAELGIIWAIIGKSLNISSFSNAALKVAEWQLNSLDHDFRPFHGLFVQEADADLTELLIYNYLLFRSAASCGGNRKFIYAAQKQLEILALQENTFSPIPIHALIIDTWINAIALDEESAYFSLPEEVYDPSTCLIGKRTPAFSALCTLYGGGTGMGSLRSGNVRILSYGPQWLPLGDCCSFGLESGMLSGKFSPFHMHHNEESFSQNNIARVASLNPQTNSHANFRNGIPCKIWMKARQAIEKEVLTIEASFIGFQETPSLAFVFFVEGDKCRIGDSKELYPRTFTRYEGEPQTVTLTKDNSTVILRSFSNTATMQVIPLSGEKNFWGADFLIAYTLDRLNHNYSWKLH